jgi:hypothetical protein
VPDCLPPASVGFLLGSFFDPEYGGDMFLRNVGLSPNHMMLNPEDRTLHSRWVEDLKFSKVRLGSVKLL